MSFWINILDMHFNEFIEEQIIKIINININF